MNILTDAMPETVAGVKVNTDYRCMVRFECRLFNPDMSPEEIVRKSMEEFYGHGRPKKGAWDAMLNFYRSGKPEKKTGARSGSHARSYDFEEDAALICAAFQQAYGIDLTTAKLHWWRFSALFDGLPSDCRICKIIEYRTADTSGMPKDTKAFYDRMRRKYAIGAGAAHFATREERDNAFIKRLRRE